MNSGIINHAISNLLIDLFSKLDCINLNYCILRNYESMPNSIGSDIDMLVDGSQINGFEKCLLAVTKDHGWKLLKKPKRYGYQSYWFYHVEDHQFVHFDAFTQINWKGLQVVDASEILYARRRYKQFYIPSSTHEVLVLFIKDLIQGENVKKKYLKKISDTVNQDPNLFLECLCRSVGNVVGKELMQHIIEDEWKQIEEMRGQIQRAVIMVGLKRNPLTVITGITMFLLKHIQCRFSKPNGVFVTFIGPDGSGKTTNAKCLRDSLVELFPGSSYYHGRFGIIPEMRTIFNMLRRFAGLKSLPRSPVSVSVAHNAAPFGSGRALFYLMYYCIDFMLGYWFVLSFRGSGRLLLFDRYYYDYFITNQYKNLPHFVFRLLCYLLPRPDLLVHLINDPEVIHARKPELTVKQISQQNKACEQIIEKLSFAIAVSTDSPIQDVANNVEEHLLELMAQRWQQL